MLITSISLLFKIIEDATDTARSASYPDGHIAIDSEGQLRMKLDDKRN